MKRKTKIQKLIEADQKACDNEDYEIFQKVLKKYTWTEDELRQLILSTDKQNAVNLIFWELLWEREFSKDFMMEMFLDCDLATKKEAQRSIRDHLSCMMEDLDPKGSNIKYAQNILDDKIALLNIRKYLIYCNPLNKDLIDDYNFYPDNLQSALCGCWEQSEEIGMI